MGSAPGPMAEGNTFPASRSVGKVRLVWSSACMLGLLQGRGRGRGSAPTAVNAPDSVCPRASRCDVAESFSKPNVLALLALGGYAGISDASVRAVREATGRAFETAGAARARREAVVGAFEVAAARAAAIVAAKVERTFTVELIVLSPLENLSSSSVTKRLGFSIATFELKISSWQAPTIAVTGEAFRTRGERSERFGVGDQSQICAGFRRRPPPSSACIWGAYERSIIASRVCTRGVMARNAPYMAPRR